MPTQELLVVYEEDVWTVCDSAGYFAEHSGRRRRNAWKVAKAIAGEVAKRGMKTRILPGRSGGQCRRNFDPIDPAQIAANSPRSKRSLKGAGFDCAVPARAPTGQIVAALPAENLIVSG